jgi:hypothetical protein
MIIQEGNRIYKTSSCCAVHGKLFEPREHAVIGKVIEPLDTRATEIQLDTARVNQAAKILSILAELLKII